MYTAFGENSDCALAEYSDAFLNSCWEISVLINVSILFYLQLSENIILTIVIFNIALAFLLFCISSHLT